MLATAIVIANVVYSVFRVSERDGNRMMCQTLPVSPETAYQAANEWKQITNTKYSFPENSTKEEIMAYDENGNPYVSGYTILGPWVKGEYTMRNIIQFAAGCPIPQADLLEIDDRGKLRCPFEAYNRCIGTNSIHVTVSQICAFAGKNESEFRGLISQNTWLETYINYMNSIQWKGQFTPVSLYNHLKDIKFQCPEGEDFSKFSIGRVRFINYDIQKRTILNTIVTSAESARQAEIEYIDKGNVNRGIHHYETLSNIALTFPTKENQTVRAITTNDANGVSVEIGYVVRDNGFEAAFVAGTKWPEISAAFEADEGEGDSYKYGVGLANQAYINARFRDMMRKMGFTISNFRDAISSPDWEDRLDEYMRDDN